MKIQKILHISLIAIILAAIIVLFSCKKEEVVDIPDVTTLSVTQITENSALCEGNISHDGGGEINMRGVVWSTTANPTIEINDGMTQDGSGIGLFTSNLTGLSDNTEYFVRAYATNSAGTGYGSALSFTTLLDSDDYQDGVSWHPEDPTDNDVITIVVHNDNNMSSQSRLHWAVNDWEQPHSVYHPSGSQLFNGIGPPVETPFEQNGNTWTVELGPFNSPEQKVSNIDFVIFYGEGNWNNNNGQDWYIEIIDTGDNGDDDGDINYGDGVTDIDGNEYITVIIGNQEWMAENLRVSQYNNGDAIPTGLSNTEWSNATNGAYAIYPHDEIDGLNSDAEVIETYGKLYNWYAVDDSRGLCPTGWHLPSDEEWTQLTDFVGSIAGTKLKAKSGWSRNGTDEYGFSALPGGGRNYGGTFFSIGDSGNWWSSTEHLTNYAWGRGMSSHNQNVSRGNNYKESGFSVRCLRD